ncbi:MAG: S-layer homology domain-containing protein [Oscillospiraceae bacterium]|nr:S-layer homology domain-containing protein [Oscillospiraceae bacterium]
MLKKLLSFLLLAAMLLPHLGQVRAANSVPTAYGIDVSHHQGVIDWDTVAKHIDFAILRCGYGSDLTSQDDRQWFANVQACTRLKIPFGVYIYSHATNEEEARSEARHVLRLLKGYTPSMPVYLDLEDEDISQNCTPAQILANATVFCDMIRAAGYTPGIYANTHWWSTYLSSPQYDKWDRWVARYNSTLDFDRPYSMWQYTSEGSVPGITGNVDMNRWYKEKPTVVCPHSYVKTVTPPTCTQGGYTTYTCSLCAHSYKGDTTASTPHSWDSGTVTVEPTETDNGEKLYTCQGCGLTMTVTLPPLGSHEDSCPAGTFEDVPPYGNWAHEGIDFALEKGLFQGVSQTLFAPDRTMNRAMLVTVLWRNAGSPKAEPCDFSDVEPGQWYTEAVAWAAENGIVKGVGEDRFAPMSHITREQLATILYRYAGMEDRTSWEASSVPKQEEPNPTPDEDAPSHNRDESTAAETESLLARFPDRSAVSPYAEEALAWAVSQGLINGVQSEGVSYLKPQGSATRAQTATILARFLRG